MNTPASKTHCSWSYAQAGIHLSLHFLTKLSWTNPKIFIDCFHYILVMVREEQILGLCIHLCFHIHSLSLSFSILPMWKQVSGDRRESLRQCPLWLVIHIILLVVWWEIRNGIGRSLGWSAGTPWGTPLLLKDEWSVYRQSGVQWVFQIKAMPYRDAFSLRGVLEERTEDIQNKLSHREKGWCLGG